MSSLVLIVLVVWAVYLSVRVRQLERTVATLTHTVDSPRKRDRAIRKEIKELEDKLAIIVTAAASGAASPEDLKEADALREKIARRIRALAGRGDDKGPAPPAS